MVNFRDVPPVRFLRGTIPFLLIGLTISGVFSASVAKAQDDLFDFADEPIADSSIDDQPGDLFGINDDNAGDAQQVEPSDLDSDLGGALVVDSAAVQAIRSRDPQTPEALVLAVDQLIQLGRTDLAAEYLDKLQSLDLSDVQLTRLQRRFGTATWIRFSRSADLAPAGSQFARQVAAAVERVSLDPRRLQLWAQRLGSSDQPVRYQSALNLMSARGEAVEPVVSAMVQSMERALVDRGDESLKQAMSNQLRYGYAVLRQLGRDAVQPLIGQLSSTRVNRRIVAMNSLGQLQSRVALPYLLGPAVAASSPEELRAAQDAVRQITGQAVTAGDAAALLRREADRSYRGLSDEAPGPGDLLIRWVWSQSTDRVRRIELRSSDAHALAAARLYRDLRKISPTDEQVKVRYLISRLNVDQGVGGLDSPLRRVRGGALDQTKRAGISLASRTLDQAMRDDHIPAAIGACQVLAELGESSEGHAVLARQWTPGTETVSAPLVQALSASDARVRFAAARALMQLNPPRSFDGASRLADTLTHFATAVGYPAVIVAHPRFAAASQYVGMFGGFRYAGLPVTSGRDAISAAYDTPDLELVILSDSLSDISTWDTIQQLRVHPNTARVPIVLLARPGREVADERMAFQLENVTVWPENVDDQAVLSGLPQVVRSLDRHRISEDQRVRQAEAALDWLAKWMSRSEDESTTRLASASRVDGARLERQLRIVLNNPPHVRQGVAVLANIGTLSAQSTLADMASETARPVSVRQAAAEAFKNSVTRFGVLLSRRQILQQYDRYNASRVLDQDTQVLLGSILDAVEARVDSGLDQVDVSKK